MTKRIRDNLIRLEEVQRQYIDFINTEPKHGRGQLWLKRKKLFLEKIDFYKKRIRDLSGSTIIYKITGKKEVEVNQELTQLKDFSLFLIGSDKEEIKKEMELMGIKEFVIQEIYTNHFYV